MIRILNLAEMTSKEISSLKRRAELEIDHSLPLADEMVKKIQLFGDKAVLEYAKKYDYAKTSVETLKVSDKEISNANSKVSPSVKSSLQQAFYNIKQFHQRQMPQEIQVVEVGEGIFTGEKVTPIASAGLYVPRGKGTFPSVMLMLAVPALVAGVNNVVVCTPPDKHGEVDPASLVAAEMAGISSIYKLGGVQALASMAFGTETIPKVDKLLGPCGIHGSAAKRLLNGIVNVGLPAGPSESIILTDESIDPRIAAIDLLVEIEHGPDSTGLLITNSEDFAKSVSDFITHYLSKLPIWRRDYCEKSLSTYSAVIITSSLEESLEFINDFAPEHLEVLLKEPHSILEKIKNAGEILLGPYASIPIANYCLGLNAILPTGGFARSYSAVSVFDFLKRTGIGYLTKKGFERLKDTTTTLADYEGFPVHAMAIKERDKLFG
jgi:histidinol dehydrogenase